MQDEDIAIWYLMVLWIPTTIIVQIITIPSLCIHVYIQDESDVRYI
jgi:hypothetical protein